jgi:uncharacterized protein (DUF427 family)
VPGDDGKDLLWYYDEPFDEVRRIKGLVCFYNERVDIELDGELQDRPQLGFSRPKAATHR